MVVACPGEQNRAVISNCWFRSSHFVCTSNPCVRVRTAKHLHWHIKHEIPEAVWLERIQPGVCEVLLNPIFQGGVTLGMGGGGSKWPLHQYWPWQACFILPAPLLHSLGSWVLEVNVGIMSRQLDTTVSWSSCPVLDGPADSQCMASGQREVLNCGQHCRLVWLSTVRIKFGLCGTELKVTTGVNGDPGDWHWLLRWDSECTWCDFGGLDDWLSWSEWSTLMLLCWSESLTLRWSEWLAPRQHCWCEGLTLKWLWWSE